MLTFILGNQRVQYGQPEPHKRIKERTGTTHPGRVPQGFRSTDSRSGNDGRPPDTASELIGKLKGSSYQGKLTQYFRIRGAPSYAWDRNSCWLDTTLHLLNQAVNRDWQSFSSHFQSTTQRNHSYALFSVLESYRLTLAELPAPSSISSGKLDKRKHAQIYDKKSLEVVRTVSTQRDNFRIFLAAEKIIGTGKDNKIYDMYPCWVWIYCPQYYFD